MQAFCYATGLIMFGRSTPKGAIKIAEGPAKPLRDFIEVRARHGYKTKKVKGRPTKIPGSDCLLVPGVPEAANQTEGVDNLRTWCDWLKNGAPVGVVIQ